MVAGQGTVWRNIFGSDPDTLDQTIVGGRAAHRASDRLDLNARASRIRTEDLDEYTYSIAASDQAGGGVRYIVTPSVQVIADGSVVSYRRAGSTIRERDGSGLVGLHWLHSRGWLQVNASRFSPGESPTLNSPLPDRAGQFAAGELDLLKRLRVFGGWEAFRSESRSERGLGRRLSGSAQQRHPAVRRRPHAGGRPLDVHASGRGRRSDLEIRHRPAGRRKRHRRLERGLADGRQPHERLRPRGAAKQRHERQPVGLLHAARRRRAVLPAPVARRRSCSAWLTATHTDRRSRRRQHATGRPAAARRLQVVRQGLWLQNRSDGEPQRGPG